MDHGNKVIVGSFFVYYEWILLCITLECYLFAEMCHPIDMLHPEFIDTCECETSLELSKLLLSSTVSEGFDFSAQEGLGRRYE
jgi:hypothetical protein